MSKKNVLVVLGHPDAESYCSALASAYAEAATEAGHQVRRIQVGELEFDPILHHG